MNPCTPHENTIEREAKFSLPPWFDARDLAAALAPYRTGLPHARRLHTMYYDSADRRLARWGISLRYRAGEGWTLKLPMRESDPYAPSRLEYPFAGTDPTRPPNDAIQIVSGTLRGVSMIPVAELRTLRIARSVNRCAGEAIAELVCDDVRFLREGRVLHRSRQIEIELAPSVDAVELDALARKLLHRTPARPTTLTKDRFASSEEELTRETDVAPLQRRPCQSDVVRSALAPALEAFMRADPHVRANSDHEWVHAARVATRKLRASLKLYGPMLGGSWATDARASLKRLSELFGAVRDADVLGERVLSLGTSLPRTEAVEVARITASIATLRSAAFCSLQTALGEKWYFELLDRLLAAVHEAPPLAGKDRTVRPRTLVARTMRRSWTHLNRAISRIGDEPSSAELHALRRRVKRSRYVADALTPLMRKRQAHAQRRFVHRLARLQERLGAIHDSALDRTFLRSVEDADRFVVGELVGLETARGRSLRTQWRATWREATYDPLRFWL